MKTYKIASFPVVFAALGYFVDMYDLLLFSIVRESSLAGVGVSLLNKEAVVAASAFVINWQMLGLLLGGILWGIMGDKKGRLSVLLGSITLYSIATFASAFVHTLDQYALARFISGIGLAGELGAGITLISEILPKNKRGLGTTLVASLGVLGTTAAYLTFKLTQDWRLCYKIGGVLGVLLLFLRFSVFESGLFEKTKTTQAIRGNFWMFFTNRLRFKKYITAVLIGMPIWYMVGILINFSNRFAKEFYPNSAVESGKAIMLSYVFGALGGLLIGHISQYFKSRKKAYTLYLLIGVIGIFLYFSNWNHSDERMYFICSLIGFSNGIWALLATIWAEQFGTNIRATAATSIPNMVRATLPLMNLLFVDLFQHQWHWDLIKSGYITGWVIMLLSFVAFYHVEETYDKDLDYIEH